MGGGLLRFGRCLCPFESRLHRHHHGARFVGVRGAEPRHALVVLRGHQVDAAWPRCRATNRSSNSQWPWVLAPWSKLQTNKGVKNYVACTIEFKPDSHFLYPGRKSLKADLLSELAEISSAIAEMGLGPLLDNCPWFLGRSLKLCHGHESSGA